MNKQRDFKGVWIPASIWLDQELNVYEKVLICEIDSLDNDSDRGCFASNEYLGGHIGKSSKTIGRMLTDLKKRGYIIQCYWDGRNRGLRAIHSQKWGDCLLKKENAAFSKMRTLPSQKGEHINKGLLIKNDDKENLIKESEAVLSFLNQLTGREFRVVNRELMSRVKEFGSEICRDVITLKWAEWRDTDMERYMKPDTLFRKSKFLNYKADVEWIKKDPSKARYFKQERSGTIPKGSIDKLREQIAQNL